MRRRSGQRVQPAAALLIARHLLGAALLLAFGCAVASAQHQSFELNGDPLLESSNWVMPANFKVAIVGDIDLRTRPISRDAGRSIYRLIKAEGAHMALCQGDLTYLRLEDGLPDQTQIPGVWQSLLDEILGADFPFFSVAGNHDVEFSQWYPPYGGHQRAITERLQRNGLDRYCRGQPGLNLFCVYKGFAIVQSGIGTVGEKNADLAWLRAQFASLEANPQARAALVWRVCAWHMVTGLYQTGSVPRSWYEDVTPEAYDICRRAGAFVVTGHEHVYARTHAMTSFSRQTMAPYETYTPPPPAPVLSHASSTGPTLPRPVALKVAAPLPAAELISVSRGTSFSVLNGCGTADIRPVTGTLDQRPHWGKTSNQRTRGPPAVLFCTFNLDGVMENALCELRGIWHADGVTPVVPGDGGHVIDRFYLRNALNANGATTAPRTGDL